MRGFDAILCEMRGSYLSHINASIKERNSTEVWFFYYVYACHLRFNLIFNMGDMRMSKPEHVIACRNCNARVLPFLRIASVIVSLPKLSEQNQKIGVMVKGCQTHFQQWLRV